MLLKWKRILSGMIAASFLFAGMSAATATEGGDNPPPDTPAATVTVSGDTGVAGNSVIVSVRVEENPGFSSYDLALTYDNSKLTANKIESNLAGTFEGVLDAAENQLSAAFTAEDPEAGITDDTILFTAEFTINEGVEPGTAAVSCAGTMQTVDTQAIELTFNDGSVTIEDPATKQYYVEVKTEGNGSARPNQISYLAGDTVTLIAEPAKDYSFNTWKTSDGISFANPLSEQTTFTMPAKNVTVTAQFVKIASGAHQIRIAEADGGKISCNKQTAKANEEVMITATPNAGYYFVSWETTNNVVLISDTSAKTYFEMPSSDVSIAAKFAKVPDGQYSVTVHSDQGGIATSSAHYFSPGEVVTLDARPSSSYYFSTWKCTNSDVTFASATSETTTFNMPAANVVITASYDKDTVTRYRVKILVEGSGKAATTDDEYSYASGETVRITATPLLGYSFYGWSAIEGSVKFVNPSYTQTSFIMPAQNVTIKAMFTSPTQVPTNGSGTGTTTTNAYIVAFNTNGGSSVASVSVNAGGTVSRPSPDPTRDGYVFGGWYADAACTISFDFTTPINAHTTIYAKWIKSDGGQLFTDVGANEWFADPVNSLATKGIVNGVGGNRFAPHDKITRAQFAQMLAKLAGANLSSYTSSTFSDIKTTDWFMKPVAWAADKGIVNGLGDNQFAPNALVTRQDMAVMIKRYVDSIAFTLPKDTAVTEFSDSAAIDSYAKDAVSAMQAAGIIGGKEGNRFDPKAYATRAEACKMIYTLMQMLQ